MKGSQKTVDNLRLEIFFLETKRKRVGKLMSKLGFRLTRSPIKRKDKLNCYKLIELGRWYERITDNIWQKHNELSKLKLKNQVKIQFKA